MEKLFAESEYPWLEERTIILGATGSYAYGTNVDESDRDYKGVCIPPISFFLGLDSYTPYDNTGIKKRKNTKDDIDVKIFYINKFVLDAMQGSPNNIELLFLRQDDYLKVTELGQVLLDNRHLFLSKQIKRRFGGYAYTQAKNLKQLKSNGAARMDLVEKFGYDTKYYMHTIRTLTSAIEILETGDFSTFRPNRDFLLDCRNGKHTFEEALEHIDFYNQKLNEAAEKSMLPESPDKEKINNLLIEINKQALELNH